MHHYRIMLAPKFPSDPCMLPLLLRLATQLTSSAHILLRSWSEGGRKKTGCAGCADADIARDFND